MIRTTKNITKFSNTDKLKKLKAFTAEGRKISKLYLDYLWSHLIEFPSKDTTKIMDILNDQLDHPTMLSNVEIESKMDSFETNLSGRVRKCLLTQVLGMIGASTEKQRKRIYMLNKMTVEGKKPSKAFMKKFKDNKPVIPNVENMNIELNSICCNFKAIPDGEFDGYLELCSLGKEYGKIRIPVKYHKNSLKYLSWNMKTSFLISNNFIDIRWEKENPIDKTEGITVGADQGIKTIITMSDGQITPKVNKHGQSLEDVMHKLSRKRKKSNAFRKAQDHRENFINWSINQLNFNNIKQINLEKIWNITYKHKVSRYMKSWTNTLIVDKLKSLSELHGVHVKEQDSTYRSQRCSGCGMVRKSNRKGKFYECMNCGNIIDADLNASLNHEVELPEVPFELRDLKLNRKGFFWKPDGFFNLDGEELTVPLCPRTQGVYKTI